MNRDMNRRYVEQSAAQLLNTTIIELSHEDPASLPSGNFRGQVFRNFSIFEHMLLLLKQLCKCFPFEKHHMFAGKQLLTALEPSSPLSVHFSVFYSEVILLVAVGREES